LSAKYLKEGRRRAGKGGDLPQACGLQRSQELNKPRKRTGGDVPRARGVQGSQDQTNRASGNKKPANGGFFIAAKYSLNHSVA
jgi:hypothetical protein